jgi:DNA-binding HxlR family transcriptional regulator
MKEGTDKFYTYQKESAASKGKGDPQSVGRGGLAQFTDEQIAAARKYAADLSPAPSELDPRIGALVNELIGRVADKWTMLILDLLTERGELRFTRISEAVPGISQKMLTQTLRQMERDGLLIRTVHPVVPPRVEYRLTHIGLSLGAAFCGVWIWAADHLSQVEEARQTFDTRAAGS